MQTTPSLPTSRPSLKSSNKRRGWVGWAVVLLTLVLAVGGLVAWRASSAKKEGEKPDEAKVFEFAESDLAKVKPQNMGLVIPFSGSLTPVTQAMVKAKVGGQVSRVHAREGERVAAGQVLASIDTADLRARHEAQLAAQAEAKARLDLATKNQTNNKALLEKNFISQNAFDSAANSVAITQANYQAAVAQAAITQRALADAEVRAPFAGIVAKRAVNIGEKITADAPVMHIVDLSRMELEAAVPVGDIPNVRIGQEIAFKVDGFEGREFKGKVERINPAAEAGLRTIAAFVTLPNPDGALKGGMFANGTLRADGRENVNTIPLAAVIEEGGQAFVYAFKDGVVERKPVVVGTKSAQRGIAEVREGLRADTTVITVKADGLKHGAKAVVKSASAAPAKQQAASAAPAAPATKS
jgi:RND family efflux transporter MFP subunit